MIENSSTYGMQRHREEQYLKDFHRQKIIEFMPVIVCMAVVFVLGIIGNAVSIVFYGFKTKRTPTAVLITYLSCVDLVVCLLIAPNVVVKSMNVYYTNRTACKIVHFLGHAAIYCSIPILWLIAVDRHRRICYPFRRQLTISMIKKIMIGFGVLSVLLSVRELFNFDVIEIELYKDGNFSVIGYYCTTTDDQSLEVSVIFFHILDAALILIVILSFFVTYGHIVLVLIKTRSSLKKFAFRNSLGHDCGQANSNMLFKTHCTTPVTLNSGPENEETHNAGAFIETSAMLRNKQRHTVLKSERAITLLMFALSLCFCLCFFPYFIIKLGMRYSESTSDVQLDAASQFGKRLPYIYSFTNPIMFCLFNPHYRKYAIHIILKLKTSFVQKLSCR